MNDMMTMSNEKSIPDRRDVRIILLWMFLGVVLLVTGACETTESDTGTTAPADKTGDTFKGTAAPGRPDGSLWKVGTPIVWYQQGPGAGGRESVWATGFVRSGKPPPAPRVPRDRFEMITPAVAKKLAEGGFNAMFVRNLDDLDYAHAHGMRGILYVHEGKEPWRNVFHPDAVKDPKWLAKLGEMIDSVKDHPAMYAYYLYDEPGTKEYPALAELVALIRERDPKHMAYINMFPVYASSGAQGTSGDKITCYREYLRRYLEEVKPDLISYDHFHMRFTSRAFDSSEYFLNLALVREASVNGGVPFLNVIQASSMGPGSRQPTGDEGRYLAFTTLAYGGQGICQFVYNSYEGAEHWGGVEYLDGTLTPLGKDLRQQIHPEFVAVGKELQPLTSRAVYHLGTGELPQGGVKLPVDASFTVDPPVAKDRKKGILLGYFGSTGKATTHVLVVNLDYISDITTTIVGPGPMEVFDAETQKWENASDKSRAKINVIAGGGNLLRLRARR